ncbi:MAG TPA: phosphatidate cytidylyltransferase, partial [Rhodocyclaceae bacterium]|nr:phosphatidate cytidylyltransferase [Rhodocyclaceae bacterium]
VVVPLWLHFKWPLGSRAFALAAGIVVIVPTWVAIVQLRLPGPLFLLAVMAAVWIADVGAYLFGRLFGRHKLAINISPGKTWEGAIGGGVLVLLYGLVLRHLSGVEGYPLWVWIAVFVALGIFSVIGDLLESLLKRQVGLKDSSAVLPGHGGVMDRIDSLTSVLPLAAFLLLVMEAA